MKTKRFSVEQIVAGLKEAGAGMQVVALIHRIGITSVRQEWLHLTLFESIVHAQETPRDDYGITIPKGQIRPLAKSRLIRSRSWQWSAESVQFNESSSKLTCEGCRIVVPDEIVDG